MTDAPTWPGVAEYLYHAASSELVTSDGTWIVPSELTPRCSSFEFRPIAGMLTDTGSERRSDSPADAPTPPAAAAAGDRCGAWTWAPIATPTVATPPRMSRAPAIPARLARRLGDVVGGGAYPLCGQETTTPNPAIRRHLASPKEPSPPCSPACSTRVA